MNNQTSYSSPFLHHLQISLLVTLLTTGLLLLALPAAAHTLTAPATVQADGSGNYETTATFLVGPGSVRLVAANVYGTENSGVDEVMIDFFCTTEYAEGEELEFPVVGQLVNPADGAMVAVQVFDCDEIEYWVEIEVLPTPVSTEDHTWGSMKARYRGSHR
jgi:hypothetical protein